MKGILKRISLMALTLLSLSPFTYSQTAPLYKLYNQKDYPGILRELDNAEGDVKAVFQAASLRAYGDNEAAVKMLRSVRPSNDTLRFVQLTTLLYANVGRSDYSSALAAASERLSRYRTWIAPEDIVDDEEQLKILRIINGVPPMRVTKKADSRITLKKDLAGLANIPVKAADSLHSFVFDSGAGMSVISDSYARKLKFRVLGDSTVRIKSGSTGVYTAAKLAVADKIFIANVEMRNAVFLVFPDSALAFAGGRYVMNGIIGFPEISAMGEIALAGQELIVPAVTPKAKIRPNMIIEDYMPVVYLTYRGTELPFTFDTGASSSSISDNFYYRYKHLVESSGVPRTKEFHGVGGASKKFDGFVLPEITMQDAAGTPVSFEKVFVRKDRFEANADVFYGNIGQDVIRSFKSITINFANGYMLFNR